MFLFLVCAVLFLRPFMVKILWGTALLLAAMWFVRMIRPGRAGSLANGGKAS